MSHVSQVGRGFSRSLFVGKVTLFGTSTMIHLEQLGYTGYIGCNYPCPKKQLWIVVKIYEGPDNSR